MSDSLGFDEVRRLEKDYLDRRRLLFDDADRNKGRYSALCLSGGGVRSAAFCLGFVIELARKGMLARFDYLSTVSGGGYAGAFIGAWVRREPGGYRNVEQKLSDASEFSKPESPLHYLLKYSNYLTPKVGLTSLDSLAGAVLLIRNLLLNWMILVPFLFLLIIPILLLERSVSHPLFSLSDILSPDQQRLFVVASQLIAILLICWSYTESLRLRPGWRSNAVQIFPKFIWGYSFVLFTGAFMLWTHVGNFGTSFEAICSTDPRPRYCESAQVRLTNWPTVSVVFVAALLPILAFVQTFFLRDNDEQSPRDEEERKRLFWKYGRGVVLILQGMIVWPLFLIVNPLGEASPAAKIVFSPLLLVGIILLGEAFYVALTSAAPRSDVEREWLARFAGLQLRFPVLWAIFAGVVLYHDRILGLFGDFIGPVMTVGSGAITLWLGRARQTLALVSGASPSSYEMISKWVLNLSVPVFLVLLTAYSTQFMAWSAVKLAPVLAQQSLEWITIDVTGDLLIPSYVVLLLLLACVWSVASFYVGINRFSLHDIYRVRLIRTFLGASNPDRIAQERTKQGDTTTWFDIRPTDNINLHVLVDGSDGKIPSQVHLVNMAMNVLSSSDLAIQERRALPFCASGFAVGSRVLRNGRGAFVRAEEFSDNLSLGTVMAVSGAAVSPNMGYHSRPMLNVLLTAFNLRLGAWFGNPVYPEKAKKTGPLFAAFPLLREAMGLTNENYKFVNLSDGGHFDNLGLYEVLARQCGLIVVVDGGRDPSGWLTDLGVADRIAALDLPAEIMFKADEIAKIREGKSGFAEASIDYGQGVPAGKLLYFRPCLRGGEPISVQSYSATNKNFPHDSTLDQWFGESQFFAYLRLGKFIASSYGVSEMVRLWFSDSDQESLTLQEANVE